MKRSTIYGQNLLDLALILTGSVEGVVALATRNGRSVTDDLLPGDVVEYDLSDIAERAIVAEVAKEGICPATMASDALIAELLIPLREQTGADVLEDIADDPGTANTSARVFTVEFGSAFA
jgi:hypothetical protein